MCDQTPSLLTSKCQSVSISVVRPTL